MNRATTLDKGKALTEPPRKPYQTFLNFPLATDLDNLKADVAILGLPYGAPYRMSEVTNDQSNAPTAVRQASARMSQALDRHDFDFDGPLFAGKDIRVVDCGDVIADPWDMKAHYRNAEAAARKILPQVKMLLSIGGDHGVLLQLRDVVRPELVEVRDRVLEPARQRVAADHRRPDHRCCSAPQSAAPTDPAS